MHPDADDEHSVDATTEQKLLADTSDIDTDEDVFDTEEVSSRMSTCPRSKRNPEHEGQPVENTTQP